MSGKLVVVGSLNTDSMVKVDRMPRTDTVAVLTVTRYGTQSAMPGIAEVLEFMEARK